MPVGGFNERDARRIGRGLRAIEGMNKGGNGPAGMTRTPAIYAQVPWGCILGKNNTGSDLAEFTAVSLVGLVDGPSGVDADAMARFKYAERRWLIQAFASSDMLTHGMTQTPIKAGEVGVVRVRGLTPARITVDDALTARFATPSPATPAIFAAGIVGGSRVKWVEFGTGTKWGIIDLHSERYIKVGGILTGTLTPGASATMTILDDATGANTGKSTTIQDTWNTLPSSITAETRVFGSFDAARNVVIFEGVYPSSSIFCGKSNTTWAPGTSCSCSVYHPGASGGLGSDTGSDVSVVDIGVLTGTLPANTTVYWCVIEGVKVLIAPPGVDAIPWGCILGRNTTGSAMPAWQAVAITDTYDPIVNTDAPGMDLFKKGTRTYSIAPYSEEYQNRFGIPQETIAPGEVGLVRIRGLSYTQVVSTGAAGKNYAMPNGSGLFDRKLLGPCRIWTIGDGDGTKDAVIDVHSERTAKIGGVLAGALLPGSSATLNLYFDASTPASESATIEDTWGILPQGIASGQPAVGTYDFDERRARFDGPFPTLQPYVGKCDATFTMGSTQTCSIWSVNGSGGLLADTGINATVVDIGLLSQNLAANTPVAWIPIGGTNVLLGPAGGGGLPWGCVYGKNNTGSTIPAWKTVTITNSLVNTLNPADPVGMAEFTLGTRAWNIADYSNTEQNGFGITQQDIPANAIGLVRVRGPSPALITIVNASYKGFVIPNSDGTLKTQSFGPCRVLMINAGAGSQWGVIDLHSERTTRISGRLAGNITQGGTATLNIYAGCETATGESCLVRDESCCLPSAGLTSSGAKKIFADYNYQKQEAFLLGYQC